MNLVSWRVICPVGRLQRFLWIFSCFLGVFLQLSDGGCVTSFQQVLDHAKAYAADQSQVDIKKETLFARSFSKAIKAADKNLVKKIMRLSMAMRCKMLQDYPHLDEAFVKEHKSLGVALFFDKSCSKEEAVRVLLREAWLFSRAARSFLSILLETDLVGVDARTKKRLFFSIRTFYDEAAALGRREEAYHAGICLIKGLGVEKNVPQGLALLEKSGRYGAERYLMAHAWQKNQSDKAAFYWKAFVRKRPYRRFQKNAARSL